MTTAATLVQRIERHLLAGLREPVNRLAAGLTDTTGTSVTCTYDLDQLTQKAVIEVDTELMYVWNANVSDKTLTVERGFRGSTAATHVNGAQLRVNPRFPWLQIFEAINAELADLSSPEAGLFRVGTLNLTTSSTADTYNLTGVISAEDLLEVSYDSSGVDNRWPDITRFATLRHSASTAEFASGYQLKLDIAPEPGRTLRVIYQAPFTALTALTDDLTTTGGLPSTADDIVEYGVAARLLGHYSAKRTYLETQGDSRHRDEVSPGAVLREAAGLLSLRDARVRAERARLRQRYPYRAA